MHTCAELTNSDFAEINIPSTLQTIMECVSKEAFYKELHTYNQNQKHNSSQITLFIEDEFYDSAKEFLKSQAENAVSDSNTNHDIGEINKVASNNTQQEEMVVPSRENLNHRANGSCTEESTILCSDFGTSKDSTYRQTNNVKVD